MAAPRAQQRARHRLLLGEASSPAAGAIQFADAPPESSTSTRSSASARIGERERPLGRGEAGRVRYRMAGFDHRHQLRRPPVAVAGDREPGEPPGTAVVEIVPLGDLGHRARRLAGGEQDQPPRAAARQVRGQARAGWAAATALRNNNSRKARTVLSIPSIHVRKRRMERRQPGLYVSIPSAWSGKVEAGFP